MADLTSIITIVVIIAAIYFFIKFIVSPIIKLVVGIVAFLVILYVLEHFFNINLYEIFGPFGKYLDISNLGANSISNFINYCIDRVGEALKSSLQNIPQITK